MLQESRLMGTVFSFIFGVFIKIVPADIPDMVTWVLQNIAFVATIIAAWYTIKQKKRHERELRELRKKDVEKDPEKVE
jgi:ABC-type xylose transport system permease subunit